MSNIRKSFNFRDGVQVDDDIFIVRGALVGIGTSVPTERLDVRGTVSVSGLLTATNIRAIDQNITGSSTIGKLFVGITSINSGIITSTTTSGIITYYGDGGRLLNLPTSQWLDVDVGLGFTSIYAQGYVGIATFDPRFVLQVGGNSDVNNFKNGVGISSSGDIKATGFVTAYSYVGYGTGITNLNASNVSDGTLNNAHLPNTISIRDFIGLGITVSTAASIANVNISSGIVTSSTPGINTIKFYGDGANLINLNASSVSSGTLNNARLPQTISVTGSVSATGGFSGNLTGNVTGNITGNSSGTAAVARALTGTPDIVVGIITSGSIGIGGSANITSTLSVGSTATLRSDVSVSGNLSVGGTFGIQDSFYVDGFVSASSSIFTNGYILANDRITTLKSISVGQTAYVAGVFNVGSGVTITPTGTIGVGTGQPLSDVELRKPSNATISVISDSGQARIAISQVVGAGNSSAVLRFGNSPRSLDIVNNDYGNFNSYLHSGSLVGLNTGSFNWIYGRTGSSLMTLTYTGKLGVGQPNPINDLHVVGTSTVTDAAYFGNSIYVDGPITFGPSSNKITLGQNSTSAIIANLNLYNTLGVTTLSQLHVLGINSVGIGTNKPTVGFDASRVNGLINTIGVGTLTRSGVNEILSVFGTGSYTDAVAIGSDRVYNSVNDSTEGTLQVFGPLKIYESALLFSGTGVIGIGTDDPAAIIDLSKSEGFLGERMTFLPPVMTTGERNAMTDPPEGGIIYNSSTNTHQGFNGTTWNNFY